MFVICLRFLHRMQNLHNKTISNMNNIWCGEMKFVNCLQFLWKGVEYNYKIMDGWAVNLKSLTKILQLEDVKISFY